MGFDVNKMENHQWKLAACTVWDDISVDAIHPSSSSYLERVLEAAA